MSGSYVVALLVLAALIGVLFYAPLGIPSWVRTVFGIVLAVAIFIVILNMLGVIGLF